MTSCSCAISETFEYQGDGTPGFQRDNFDFRLRGMVGEMFVAIVIRVEMGGGRCILTDSESGNGNYSSNGPSWS